MINRNAVGSLFSLRIFSLRTGLSGLLLMTGVLLQGCNQNESIPAQKISTDQDQNKCAAGHIVVKFAPGLSAESMQSLARDIGASAVEQPEYADFHYVKLPEGLDPVIAAKTLADRPGVVYSEPDPLLHLLFTPNDEYYSSQWNLQMIGMEEAWDINPGASSDVVVAVADTGVALFDGNIVYPAGAITVKTAPDLRGTNIVAPRDFVWGSNYPADYQGHGTHVAGTIAQRTNNGIGAAGMAYNASIMPLKVIPTLLDYLLGLPFPASLDADSAAFASRLAQATRYAADNGAHVINMSLGSYQPLTSMEDALRYAVDNGVFIAIAAGNEAERPGSDDPLGRVNPIEYPAKYAETIDGVVAVAALGANLQRAPYSNFHSYVELAAPGGNMRIRERDGILQQTLACEPAFIIGDYAFVRLECLSDFKYDFYQGTSMATPHVAGFAALLVSQGITSPAAIEAAMKRFAIDVPPSGRDDYTGYGVINPRDTLLGLGLAR
ncbi:MAG: S8 family serine peptidase [Vicinamibacteria bacterium]|nr:S8 family serine peptidase [Vicinamibacteria bacterium]